MVEAIKVLGQLKPAAATLSSLYTVPATPALAHTVVSSVTVCEQAGAATTFRLSVAVAGAADAPAQYIAFDVAISANETKAFTIGLTLGAADVLRCYSAAGSVSFNAFGAETA